MSQTVAVLGSGGWGTAVALLLAHGPRHRVRLWSAHPANAAKLAAERSNARLLPGANFPDALEVTGDARDAVSGADLRVSAIPTTYLRATLGPFAALRAADVPVVSLTKGLEVSTFQRPSEIISGMLGTDNIAVLSGPSHAEEVAAGMPTSVVVAANDGGLAARVQRTFGTDRFRVYTNNDLAGVELAGALKNVIGIVDTGIDYRHEGAQPIELKIFGRHGGFIHSKSAW